MLTKAGDRYSFATCGKHGVHKVRGMPVKTIRAMLASNRTPPRLKAFWQKQMKKVV